MAKLNRREFIGKTAAAVGTALGARAWGAESVLAPPATRPATKKILRANDVVALGKTGLKTSRLAIGTGTAGGSEQRSVGIDGMVKLFRHSLDQGIFWWDAADMYKTHPHVQAALKEVRRDKVIITSKTWARTADGVRADIERYRKEMNTDYIDILLLHCLDDSAWPQKLKPCMDVLSEAKDKGIVRAIGCSHHAVGALEAAANTSWGDVHLARINPFAKWMDVKEPTEVPKVVRVLEKIHAKGKAIYGMKILGQGDFKEDRINASLRFALSKPFISAFTIGFSRPHQVDDIIQRIERLRMTS